jgi:hypothetical protein
MALVQGIYDLGEPGREAKPMKLKHELPIELKRLLNLARLVLTHSV